MSTTKEFSVVIERDEDGYYVAKSLGESMARVKEVIELCLEVEEETSIMGPPKTSLPMWSCSERTSI